MKNIKSKIDENILEEAQKWILKKDKVVLATVLDTWGSSPRSAGSRMIINDKGNFSGSVSGGCVETSVIQEALEILKNEKKFKTIKFRVSNENAWEVGLACGGEILVFIEKIF